MEVKYTIQSSTSFNRTERRRNKILRRGKRKTETQSRRADGWRYGRLSTTATAVPKSSASEICRVENHDRSAAARRFTYATVHIHTWSAVAKNTANNKSAFGSHGR